MVLVSAISRFPLFFFWSFGQVVRCSLKPTGNKMSWNMSMNWRSFYQGNLGDEEFKRYSLFFVAFTFLVVANNLGTDDQNWNTRRLQPLDTLTANMGLWPWSGGYCDHLCPYRRGTSPWLWSIPESLCNATCHDSDEHPGRKWQTWHAWFQALW